MTANYKPKIKLKNWGRNKRNCANKKNDAIFETTLRLKRTFHANRKIAQKRKSYLRLHRQLKLVTKHHICKCSTWITVHCFALHSNKHKIPLLFIHSFNSFCFVLSLFTKFPILFTLCNSKWVFSFECRQFCEFFPLCKSLIWNSFPGAFALLNVLPFVTQTQNIHRWWEWARPFVKYLKCFFHFFYAVLPLESLLFSCSNVTASDSIFLFFFSFHHIQQQPFCVHFNLVLSSVVERFCFNATFCTQKFCVCVYVRSEVGVGTRSFISNMYRTN